MQDADTFILAKLGVRILIGCKSFHVYADLCNMKRDSTLEEH